MLNTIGIIREMVAETSQDLAFSQVIANFPGNRPSASFIRLFGGEATPLCDVGPSFLFGITLLMSGFI